MGYKSAIDLIKNKCDSAKGNIYFDIGTAREFNEDDNRDFPLVYVRRPITSTKIKNANGIIVQEIFNMNIQALQTCELGTSGSDQEKFFQDMNYILISLLNELLANDYQLNTGTAIQIQKENDLITIGWEIPIQLTIDVDADLCCSLFEE